MNDTKIRSDAEDLINNLGNKRILVCGKGGCGKSTISALLSIALKKMGLSVIAIDGDCSNPGGLHRFLFGTKDNPKPLIDFFGGRKVVECPVDNPEPLTRLNDSTPVIKENIDPKEIPTKYFDELDGIKLFQVGKISNALEGCDGPMSKVTRDFIVKGNFVTLIDVEAGIEHFGRGIETNIDIILIVVDPTHESFLIAEKVNKLAKEMNLNNTWAILNKFRNSEVKELMEKELQQRDVKVIGALDYNSQLESSGLLGKKLVVNENFSKLNMLITKLSRFSELQINNN